MKSKREYLLGVMVWALFFVSMWGGLATSAAEAAQPIKVSVDGQAVSFDVPPYVDKQNRTMVPLRFVGDKLGYQCMWQPAAQEVHVAGTDKSIRLFIGKKTAEVDGQPVAMDTMAVLVSGRTMVPLRFIMENMGAKVVFDTAAKVVAISRPTVKAPPSEVPMPVQAITGQVAVVDSKIINIRSGPGTEYPVIKQAAAGEILLILAQSGDWFQVSIDQGQLGWVANWVVVKRGVTEVASRGEESGSERPVEDADSLEGAEPVDPENGIDPTETPDDDESLDPNQPEDEATDDVTDEETEVQPDGEEAADEFGISGKTIVIDPGHASLQSGASDPGAIGPHGVYEKNVVLAIAIRLKDQLEAAGATVLMTRTGDTNLSLTGRAALANLHQADVFVSIHANANTSSAINGTSTYYYGGVSGQAEVRKKLAQAVQSELVQSLGRQNRGVLSASFVVLRETVVPSILVETAFLSNPTEEALLTDGDFQELAAVGITNGLIRYFQE